MESCVGTADRQNRVGSRWTEPILDLFSNSAISPFGWAMHQEELIIAHAARVLGTFGEELRNRGS